MTEVEGQVRAEEDDERRDPEVEARRRLALAQIRQWPDSVLRLRANEVEQFDGDLEPVAEAVYRDHHLYTENDIRELLALKARCEAEGFVTTEKDAINLGGYLSAAPGVKSRE